MTYKRKSILVRYCLVIFVLSVGLNVHTFGQSNYAYVVEGDRFDSIVIGKSTIDDVKAVFGTNYVEVKHKYYSTELQYRKLGLSFYSCQEDPKKEIFVVEIRKPYRAMTSKGIVLGESTFGDVLRLYGDTKEINGGFGYDGIVFDNIEIPVDDQNEDTSSVSNSDKSKTKEIGLPTLDAPIYLQLPPYFTGTRPQRDHFEIPRNAGRESYVEKDDDDDSNNDNEKRPAWSEEIKAKVITSFELIERNGLRQCPTRYRH